MSELSCRGDADVFGIQCDASDVTSAREAVAAAEDQLGGIDVLVSAVAGNATPDLLVEQNPESLADVLQGLLLTPMLLTRLALPHMYRRGTGAVILVSSDAAKIATSGETSIGGAMAGS